MKTTYSIDIKEPCHENWDNMLPHKQGKFCEMCQKNVHDVSQFSDAELANFISKNKNICARVRVNQLHKPLQQKTKWQLYHKTYAKLAAALGLFFLSGKSYAQGKVMLKDSVQIVDSVKKKTHYHSTEKKGDKMIGKVVDYENAPAPFCTILLEENNYLTEADAEGNFNIPIENLPRKDSIRLIVIYDGFKQLFVLNKNDYLTKTLELTFTKTKDMLNQTVIRVGFVVTKRKKWWQFWK